MWYSVKVLFKSLIDEVKKEDALCEKTIFLINVDDKNKVQQKAEQIARANEIEYQNSDQNQVAWRFVKILEIQDLCESELFDGIEVFSQLLWESELDDEDLLSE